MGPALLDGAAKGDKVAGQLPIIRGARLDRDCVGPHMIWLSLSIASCPLMLSACASGRLITLVDSPALLNATLS